MQEFILPRAVKFVLDRLNSYGYEAYVVGGCVRDHLMCRTPSDYDVTTNAYPDEMKAVFSDSHLVETGLKHGTLTVVCDEMNIEVTTYRVDGVYDDGRHPREVTFTASLEEDLCRRDFTVNAIAYSPKDGFVDPFDGRGDIERRRIACVGDPVKRFSEDALRILRALRFSSTLGFCVDSKTADAVNDMYKSLSLISRERIYQELTKLFCGQSAKRVMAKFSVVVAYAMDPTGIHITPSDIFDSAQHMDCTPCYPEMRYAVTFCHASFKLHELARVYRFDGENFIYTGNGEYAWEALEVPNFHKYCKDRNVSYSIALARHVYASLKPSRKSMKSVLALLENRFANTSDPYTLKKLMGKYDVGFPECLMWFKVAMRMISCEQYKREAETYYKLRDARPCVTISELAVSGSDAVSVGLHGENIGRALAAILDSVMREEIPNDREILMGKLRELQEIMEN